MREDVEDYIDHAFYDRHTINVYVEEGDPVISPKSKSKLKKDIEATREFLNESGYYQASIAPEVIKVDNNQINLIINIDKKEISKIKSIYFIGNKNFSDRELNEEISTKKTIWWKFLSSSDIFDSDRLEYDKELLRRFYNNNGFADFNTISAIAQINLVS